MAETTTQTIPDLFDANYYLQQNPDVAAAGADAWQHYLNYGWKEGRNPAALFNTNYYLTENPDVANAGVNPLLHYLSDGWKEGRNPDAWFNTDYYLAENPDVANAGVNPLLHYEAYGWKEARDPSGTFDTSYYLAQNPDVAQAGIDPLQHYLNYGQAEGRQTQATSTFNIEVDYSRYDTDGFFTNQPERQAVVEEACKVWESIFKDEFTDIPAGTTIQVRNPDTGTRESVVLTQPIDDLRIYFGSYYDNGSSLGHTMVEATSNTGNTQMDARYNSYDNIEPWVGSIAINDKYANSLYFDPTPNNTSDDTVPGDKYDFLHILVHEIGHVLGMGPQNAGSQYVTSSNGVNYFGGPNVKAVYGGAVPLDFATGAHFASNATMSAVMKPSLDFGTRVLPTALDKAFFADIGDVLK